MEGSKLDQDETRKQQQCFCCRFEFLSKVCRTAELFGPLVHTLENKAERAFAHWCDQKQSDSPA